MKILLNGDEPFGKCKVNPSEIAAKKLDGEVLVEGVRIIQEIIPLR